MERTLQFTVCWKEEKSVKKNKANIQSIKLGHFIMSISEQFMLFFFLQQYSCIYCDRHYVDKTKRNQILYNVLIVLVRTDMFVNERERLSNITLIH